MRRLLATAFLLSFGMSAYAQEADCPSFSDADVEKVSAMAADLMHNAKEVPTGNVDNKKRESLRLDMSALKNQAQANATASKSCCDKGKTKGCCAEGGSDCCKRKIARDSASAFAPPNSLDGASKTMEGRCTRKGG